MFSLFACVENELGPTGEKPAGFDTGTGFSVEDSDETSAAPVESCNGLDDDGDGEVDEGFDDVDADGLADCVDGECALSAPAPRAELDASCEGEVGSAPSDPWTAEVLWHWGDGSVLNTPVVGDLDLDGVPEVVFDDDQSRLNVVDGASGSLEWSYPDMAPWAGAALGDIDDDGLPDVVGTRGSCGGLHSVLALDNTGNLLWETSLGLTCEPYPLLADLDADGKVEVVLNQYVLDGATGDIELTLDLPDPSSFWGVPAVADLDLDGRAEILLFDTVFDLDGNELLSCGNGGEGSFSQPVNLDADEEGEVLVSSREALTACDTDGTELWRIAGTGSYGSAVAVADFDGDGLQEMATAETNALLLIDDDGSELWRATISDASGLSGCTSWDVDLDGVAEVIYADERDLWVVDGRTGSARIQFAEHDSRTTSETPAVADVDGDGHGEIVYASDQGASPGVTAIRAVAGDWPYAPPVYNQHAFDPEGVDAQLEIARDPTPSWLADGLVFRGQPSAVHLAGLPNLHVDIADACAASCEADGVVQAWLQVWNDGGDDADAVLTWWGLPGGVQTEIGSSSIEVPSGGSVELALSSTVAAVGDGLVATLSTGDQCEEGEDRAEWLDLGC